MDGLVRALVSAGVAVGLRQFWRDLKQGDAENTWVWVESEQWPGWKQTMPVAEARRRGYKV